VGFDYALLEGLKSRPETYKTLLGDAYGRNTMTTLMSLQMNKAVRRGQAFVTTLEGTRFKERMFFHPDKEYVVVIGINGREFKYYFTPRIEWSGAQLTLHSARELRDDSWVDKGIIVMDKGEVVRCF